MSRNNHIPLRHYKIFLSQMCNELIDKLEHTGFKPSSKRSQLTTEFKIICRKLERELKRDVTLKESAKEKRDLFIELFDKGAIPSWILDTIFHSLTEETRKLNRVSSDV